MAADKHGKEIKVGDIVKFEHEGEVHFGKVEKIHEDGDADLVHVIHAPKAVEHHVVIAHTELTHRSHA